MSRTYRLRQCVRSKHACGALSLMLSLAIIGCGQKEAKPRLSDVERLPRVEVVTPLRTNLERRIEISATIEPMEKAELCARVPGVVETVFTLVALMPVPP